MHKTQKTLAQKIASAAQARQNCIALKSKKWLEKHTNTLRQYEKALPCGAGFDAGCTIDLQRTSRSRIVILAPFHVTNSAGYYVGWIDFVATITPEFDGFSIDIPHKNDVRKFCDAESICYDSLLDSVYDTLVHALSSTENTNVQLALM